MLSPMSYFPCLNKICNIMHKSIFQRCLKNIHISQGAQGPRSKADLLKKKGVAVGKRGVWVRNIARRLRAGRDFRGFGFLKS